MTWTHEIAINFHRTLEKVEKSGKRHDSGPIGHFQHLPPSRGVHSLHTKMQENVSILETIVADMPDMFYSEILPKLGLFETLNLAKVSKKYRDLVWTVAGARSFPAKVEAHFAKVNVLAGTSPASFDAPLFENMTPLFWAARHGNLRAVKALLESGEDPDEVILGTCETSPLLTSIPERLEIVRALLQAGADPNGVEDNFSPLWFAVCDGSKESIVELVNAGAHVDLEDLVHADEVGKDILSGGETCCHRTSNEPFVELALRTAHARNRRIAEGGVVSAGPGVDFLRQVTAMVVNHDD